MAEKEITAKGLQEKLKIYQRRRKRLWVWLIVELVILWILNPEFIPEISVWVAAVQTFFGELLWPHTISELGDGTYRAYIYFFWTWLEDLPFFPVLEAVVPRIVPVWLVITYIQGWIAKGRIRNLKKPPREKGSRLPKTPKKQREKPSVGRSVGPTASGMYISRKMEAMQRFKTLQESCTPLMKSEKVSLKTDQGLWIGNQATGENDEILHWDDCGIIEKKLKENTLKFQLNDDGVWIYTNAGFIQLEKGVPLTIAHKNEAGNEILDMTVTWLGGLE